MRKAALLLLAVMVGVQAPGLLRAAEDRDHTYQSFYSEALELEMNYRLFLPPGYEDGDQRYPTAYLLHGYNFTRNMENPPPGSEREEENHWMDQENLAEVAGCMMSVDSREALASCLDQAAVPNWRGVTQALDEVFPDSELPIKPMIVIMPDGNNGFYVDRPDGLPTFPPAGPDDPRFAHGLGAGSTGMFETYIVRDLIEHADSTWRTAADRSARFIGGFSMGGLGTANLLLRNPELFSAGAAMSISFDFTSWLRDPFAMQVMQKTTPEIMTLFFDETGRKPNLEFMSRYDPLQLAAGFDHEDTTLYFDAGANDYYAGRDQFKSFAAFRAALEAAGVEVMPDNHVIAAAEHNGKAQHNADYWRSRLGVILMLFSNRAP